MTSSRMWFSWFPITGLYGVKTYTHRTLHNQHFSHRQMLSGDTEVYTTVLSVVACRCWVLSKLVVFSKNVPK